MSKAEPRDPGTVQVPGSPTGEAGQNLALLVSCSAGVTSHNLPPGGDVVLGRGEDTDIPVLDESVSRRHAVIHVTPSAIELEDLGSTNGTRIAGTPLASGERRALGVGAVAELGSATIVLQRARLATGPGASTTQAQRPTPSPVGTPPKAPGPSSDVIIRSPGMKQLYELLDVVAPSPIPILILGETGVGKEIFAEEVHKRSPRSGKPFLRLNCAALPETILESELFGHEKGSFTGAVQTKIGLLESADTGTVFLDEVGELPPVTQAKMLRFLESGEILRVGGLKPKRVDVRLVSATNRDLSHFIATGRFRSDLFFRINGISVTIAALRKRKEDILPLAEMFIGRAVHKVGRPAPAINTAARLALETYSWPGNVRELRNVVERAVVLAQGGTIGPEHLMLAQDEPEIIEQTAVLPAEATGRFQVASPGWGAVGSGPTPSGATMRPAAPGETTGGGKGTLLAEVENLEKQRILDALERCGGNQSRAAKELGISRRMLITRLDAYGIVRPRKGQG